MTQVTWKIDPRNGPVGSPRWHSVKTSHAKMKKGLGPTLPSYLNLRPLAWSCRGCGALRTIPDHLLHSGSGVIPPCRPCANRSVQKTTAAKKQAGDPRYTEKSKRQAPSRMKRAKALYEESLEHASRHHQEWTGPELEILMREDLTLAQKAAMTGRTYHATRYRIGLIRKDPKTAHLADARTPIADLADPGVINIAPHY